MNLILFLILPSWELAHTAANLNPAQVHICLHSSAHSSINDTMPTSVEGIVEADLLLGEAAKAFDHVNHNKV